VLCKVWIDIFTALAFSVFSLKLFINLKSRDNNVANIPEVLHSSDISYLVLLVTSTNCSAVISF
jgi:hypothetical protein